MVLLTDIEKASFKRLLIQKVDSRLKLGLVIYLAINIASIFKMNINSAFIVGILFSNNAEVNEVR